MTQDLINKTKDMGQRTIVRVIVIKVTTLLVASKVKVLTALAPTITIVLPLIVASKVLVAALVEIMMFLIAAFGAVILEVTVQITVQQGQVEVWDNLVEVVIKVALEVK